MGPSAPDRGGVEEVDPGDGAAVDERVVLAAAANAAWCNPVCRVHGIPGSVADGLWRAGGEPPPFYPDVVTLGAGLDADAVAGAVPARAGATVKDSNAWAAAPGVWESLPAAAWLWFPGSPVAGYEQEADLASAVAAGFEPIGRLRVWLRG